MNVLPNLTSSQWAALSPVSSYILATLFFTTLETFDIWKRHRVYPSEEELKRNKVSRAAVITHAICYHSVTTALALVFVKVRPPLQECSDCFGSYAHWHSSVSQLLAMNDDESIQLTILSWLTRLTYLGTRQFIAFFIFDTWLYWTHLFSHRNRWWFSKQLLMLRYAPLARLLTCSTAEKFHSMHHELYNSFSFGSAYNHPVESLLFDIVASQLASGLPRLTDIEQGVFLSLATVRSCENHCAYKLPYSPFILIGELLGYTPEWHNIHHASFGYQASQSSLLVWG
jgi:sphinganine C4-monooxygenase